MSANKIKHLPEVLYDLTLQKLILSENIINNLDFKGKIINTLQVLNIESNKLSNICSIYNLVKLLNLNLQNNQINNISNKISNLSLLQTLN